MTQDELNAAQAVTKEAEYLQSLIEIAHRSIKADDLKSEYRGSSPKHVSAIESLQSVRESYIQHLSKSIDVLNDIFKSI